jgi:hypothetical protein
LALKDSQALKEQLALKDSQAPLGSQAPQVHPASPDFRPVQYITLTMT